MEMNMGSSIMLAIGTSDVSSRTLTHEETLVKFSTLAQITILVQLQVVLLTIMWMILQDVE